MSSLLFSLIFALLACTLQVQGDIVERAIETVRNLAEVMEEKFEEFAHVPSSTKLMVQDKFHETKQRVVSEVQARVNRAIAAARERPDCAPEAALQLEALSATVGNRFENCINFTQTIINLEVFIFKLGTQMSTVEEVVCDGIQNVTTCNDESVLLKMACISQRLTESLRVIKSQSAGIVAAFQELKDLGKNIINNFLKCFTKSILVTDSMINDIFKKHCTNNVINNLA